MRVRMEYGSHVSADRERRHLHRLLVCRAPGSFTYIPVAVLIVLPEEQVCLRSRLHFSAAQTRSAEAQLLALFRGEAP